MKTRLSFLLLLLWFSHAPAQLVTISETNQLPAIGDTIHYVDANSFGFDATGTGPVTNKVWDQSGLFLTGTSYDFYYVDPLTVPANLGRDSFPSASIARGESGAAGYFYYLNTPNSIDRLGWFGSVTNYGIYKDGTVATEFQFPITAGQTFNSAYHGSYSPFNVGEDSVRIESGTVSINADMQGTLILPSGTFSNVLRLHVIENFHIKVYLLGIPIIDYLIEDDYIYWFSDSVKQALLVSGVTNVNGTPEPPVLRYQPVSLPTALPEFAGGSFRLSPNPSSGKFTISRKTESTPDVSVEISTAGGQIVYSSPDISVEDIEVNLSDFPKGMYFVKINDGKTIHLQKLVLQ